MQSASGRALAGLVKSLLQESPEPLPESCAAALDDKQVRRLRLAPLAYRLGVPRFKFDFIQSALVGEKQGQMLAQVIESLRNAGIDVCRLKGCAYVGDIYCDPAERPMGDMDLLVRAHDMRRAIDVLVSMGFATRSEKPFVFADTHHAVTLDGHGYSVDLHRHITQARRTRIDLPAVWQRADLAQHRLERYDELAFHLAHMMRSELLVPMSAYIDLAKLLRRVDNDRAGVLRRCDAFRLGRGARAALAMMDALATGDLGFRAGLYPMPSASELLAGTRLGRSRQVAVKAMLVDGVRELVGLVYVTLRERGLRWRYYKL